MNNTNPRLETEQLMSDGVLGQPGQEFLSRVRQATVNVLADSPTGREVLELCDDHGQARRMILEDRSGGMNVVAVVGATGQGKSWLVRQLIRESPAASAAVRSGNHADEATNALVWVGPRPPADQDPQHERYIHCSANDMQSIGAPYMLLDAPGATDDRRSFAAVAARSLSLASVMLLVVRRDQIRSEVLGMLAEASEGSLVIPVVNVARKRDETLDADIDAFVARIRHAAPTSIVAAPVIIDDFEIDGHTEQEVGKQAAELVASRLQSELGNSWEGDRRRSTRLAALDGRFRSALHSVLGDQLPGLTAAVRRLNREATMLPVEVAETLVGRGGPLRAAIRSRLRISLLTETAAIWFPYKSMLGLLNLTHGAWDRVLLTLSGSLPSLVTAVWTSTKNLSADRGAQQDMRDGLQRRSAAAVADRLGPLVMRFRSELMELRNQQPAESPAIEGRDPTAQVAYLSGIDALQESSQRIFDEEVDRVSISRPTAALFGIVGTAIFWILMSGPIFALYRGYFDASYETLTEMGDTLEHFPKPEFSMMLTSFILSILPTALFSMLVISVAQSRRRVVGAEQRIRELHHETIQRMQSEGVLRLRWDEPILADAEFLLSAGAAGSGIVMDHYVCMLTCSLIARTTAPVNPEAAEGIFQIVLSGGVVGLLILLILFSLSVAAAYLLFDQIMTLRRSEVIPDGVGDAVRQALLTGSLPEADAACRRSPSVLSVVLLSGLSEFEFGWSAVEKAVEDSLAQQAARLMRRIEYLSVIGNIAPMIGLLGTVTGMVIAFQQVATTRGAAGAGDLAEGIYQALVTTVGGLIVAIPSLAIYAVCRNRVDALIAEVAYQSQQALAPIKRRPSGRVRSSSANVPQSRPTEGASGPAAPPKQP